MLQVWIACALISIFTLYLNNLIHESRSELQEQVNILQEELRALKTCIDTTHIKRPRIEFHSNQQNLESSDFPRPEKRIHF